MLRRLFIGLAAIVASLTLNLTTSFAETFTVTDTLGRSVEVPKEAKRILLGFYFEDFYAIGGPNAYDNVIAISRPTWEGWRASQWKSYVAHNPRIAEITDIGDIDSGNFSIEAAIAARPDVAIFAAWQYTMLGNAVDKFEAAGIPVVVADYNAQTIEKHVTSTIMIGKILGTIDRAQKLANEYKNAVEDVIKRVEKAGGASKKVYVELGSKGASEFGNSYGDTMWGRVISTAGGTNIAADQISKWGPLNPEYILASNPDVIIVAGSYWLKKKESVRLGFGITPDQTNTKLIPYVERSGWEGLNAVKNGEVYALYHGGARTLYDYTFLQYIAKALYPDAFSDIDPNKVHQSFYEEYLPIKADGVFMHKLAK